MMTYDELIEKLMNMNWFSNVGQFSRVDESKISLPNFSAWDSATFSPDLDEKLASIAANMDWLPTTRDQIDPVNGNKLKNELKNIPNGKEMVMDAYKLAMKSLRNFDKSKFKSGSNDFSEAAKGSALYCVRMAAIESLICQPGFWSELLDLYSDGYWPCGVLHNKIIVVY
ncbi:hypothetical protein VR7878_02755 [Vibrio ruber DSM 16370]|uniref:Uncharacterized protein n=1 Tax=Vibrio ruber (strain DSM 16370 / JCM 11486 / BCRC 17186 / CECT 7878 / LMG 23124 / VR1) TaxID=1123498 RepID=A0A1R4LPA6_VIBR1|nr:hypothetical protein [Vibrio ruber]SJN58283.1 hypothetical protein VR7878_02755 [Vibrio ruber DSM 16370]